MDKTPAPGPREFATTHWSLVVAANRDQSSQSSARAALEHLCRAYWYPLYAFVRNRGYSSNDAQDLTQAFFVHLIESRGLHTADPQRGRFRSFLLGAMKHYLINDWHRNHAMKRGGDLALVRLDALDPESRYALEPEQPADPDARFDREWALELIDRAIKQLQSEHDRDGKSQQFDLLKGFLTGEQSDRDEIAHKLGITEGNLKVTIHRLRQRFRRVLRAEIADTVSEAAEVDDEMKYLLDALRSV